MNLADFVHHWSRFRSDKPAISLGGETITWAELEARSARLAAVFRDLGLTPGDRLGCCMPNAMDWCVAYVATLRAGGIFVPLNPGLGAAELRAIDEDVGCRLIVSRPDHVSAFGVTHRAEDASAAFIYPRGDAMPVPLAEALASSREGLAPLRDPAREDVAVICYTSGTMGLPKGVMLTHEGIHSCIVAQVLGWEWTSEERFLLLAPLSFTGGVVSMLTTALVLGATIHVEPAFEPERALDLMTREQITYMGGVPIFWERLTTSPQFASADLSALRSAAVAGAPVSAALLNAYLAKGVPIRQAYGCTEASGMITMPTVEGAIRKPGACGFAAAHIELKVMGADLRPLAAGEPGEIWIRGRQVMKGYWNNPDATTEAFVDGWYRTGDLGALDADGDLHILGRTKSMIISGGVNIYPSEIENALTTFDGVAEAAVIGRPDPEWGERVVALVHGPSAIDLAWLKGACRERLGRYKAPKEIVFCAQPLPRTASGKVSRAHLEAAYQQALSTEAA